MQYATLRRFALSLPESAEAPHHDHASFGVRGKIFVTVPPGETHIHAFVDDQERHRALAIDADAIAPLRWGGKVVGVRIALADADAAQVKHLVRSAWARKAPKSLLP
jgi:hypothetical protein